MITTHFDALRQRKAAAEGRRLSLRQVAAETGLGFNTLQRLRRRPAGRVAFATLDRLCDYFALTSLCELLERTPDPPPDGAPGTRTESPHPPPPSA